MAFPNPAHWNNIIIVMSKTDLAEGDLIEDHRQGALDYIRKYLKRPDLKPRLAFTSTQPGGQEELIAALREILLSESMGAAQALAPPELANALCKLTGTDVEALTKEVTDALEKANQAKLEEQQKQNQQEVADLQQKLNNRPRVVVHHSSSSGGDCSVM